jgi:signal transduction histidine kinase
VTAEVKDMSEKSRDTSGLTTALTVRYVRSIEGDEGVRDLLIKAGETRSPEVLEDERSWSTYQEKIALFEAAAEVLGDEKVAQHIGETVLEHRVGLPLKLLLRTLGSPSQVLRNVAKAAPKFSTVCTMRAVDTGRHGATITYRLHNGFQPHRMDCDYNIGLISQAPVLFGLPPAQVVHPECQVDGAVACVYEVRWGRRRPLPKRDDISALADQVESITSRAAELSAATADLISPDAVEDLLARIAAHAATAVHAQSYVLAVRTHDEELKVRSEGLEIEEAETLARKLLETEGNPGGESALVVDVISSRRHHGYLAALYPQGGSFFEGERRLLEAYAHHAAVALDTADALIRARREEETARLLLDLSRTLAEARTEEQVAMRVAEATPPLLDADRSLFYLWNPITESLSVGAMRGYPPKRRESLQNVYFKPEETPLFESFIESTEPLYFRIDDVQNQSVREFMESHGAGEIFVTAITKRGELFGLLTASRTAGKPPLSFDETLSKRMHGLADQAATMLQNLRLVEQERAAVETMKEAARLKAEFLAMVSHELRTPLAAILGMSRTLQHRAGEVDERTQREFLSSIIERGRQLQRLVEDLLLSSADIEVHASPIDFAELVTAAVRDARATSENATVEVRVEGRISVLADGGRLRQVVDNLITNAVKHAPGSPVRVVTGTDGDAAWIEVGDDGPGMTREQVARVFDPFYQVDSSDNRASGGVGLGLYISKRIVEAHKGHIDMWSTEGEGTTVRFEIPKEPPMSLNGASRS